jgi:hypothetical protein
MVMTYQPNFHDPRVRRRIRRAIGFASGCLSTTRSQQWSTRYIDQWFGSQRNDLSQYLRAQLLIVTNERWNKDSGQCKEYQLNSKGIDFLSDAIGLNNNTTYPIVVEVAEIEYRQELDSGAFVYNDQSSRLWHPLQNFRRDAKRQVLDSAGYQYHYDIECCAMTLIHQHSQRIPEVVLSADNPKWLQGPMDLYLFALRDYLRDRQARRAQIAQEADMSPDLVKRIITALLAGAQLSLNPTTHIYQMLEGDRARIEFLKQHEYLTQLRADIRVMWDYIKPTMSRRSRTQPNGQERMMPISSRQKWNLYFDLERQVLNEIREFLCERGIRHFLEHDGWSCDHEIDLTELQERILERTGFQLEFEIK